MVVLAEGQTDRRPVGARARWVLKKYKPTSPGRRHGSVLDFAELTSTKPEKSLLRPLKKTGGRNNTGRITVRRRGGGHKRRYRLIDFKRDKEGVPGHVKTIEYDPNRSCNIALLHYADGEKRYIIAPLGLRGGAGRSCRARARTRSRATPCRSGASRSAS